MREATPLELDAIRFELGLERSDVIAAQFGDGFYRVTHAGVTGIGDCSWSEAVHHLRNFPMWVPFPGCPRREHETSIATVR